MTTLTVNDHFEDFLFDWNHKNYLLVGGYGSSKSYHVVEKIILKCLSEKRKVLVVREVYDTIRESCFDLFYEVLQNLDLIEESNGRKSKPRMVTYKTSPLQLSFPNGSKIIFKGMDKPDKLKSINGVSIVWIEEASEVKYSGYKELIGRLRHPTSSLHMILSLNPVGTENWVYTHFFKRTNLDGSEKVICDDQELYEKRTMVVNDVYYHHSICDDNKFLPSSYLEELERLKEYDPDLHRIARKGQFGPNGIRVLPQFEIASSQAEFNAKFKAIPENFKFVGLDFGFEESFNALVEMGVDDLNKILYISHEVYMNHVTDDVFAGVLEDEGYINKLITADCAEPKAIRYYQQQGFSMRPCHKRGERGRGSRISNTRKIKRFKKIICSPECKNTIRELKTLTYKKDQKGNNLYDEFSIDPHTFSAIWYGLDTYSVADIKEVKRNSRKGG